MSLRFFSIAFIFAICANALLAQTASPTPVGEPNDIVLNATPLRYLRETVRSKLEKKEIDLSAPFSISLSGRILPSGMIDPDPKVTKYLNPEGDTANIQFVKDTVLALNDAGFFQYLRDLGGDGFMLRVKQDKATFSASMAFTFESPAKAQSIASGFKLLISAVKMKNPGTEKQTFFNALNSRAVEKDAILSLETPVQVKNDIVLSYLKPD